MTKGGLYIPLPEHIEIYCSTSSFLQCPQYTRGMNLIKEYRHTLRYTQEEGRRRYYRVSDNYILSISVNNKDGSYTDKRDERVSTIDLSMGGMRIESNVEVNEDEKIAFSFGHDFTIPRLFGMGKVKWSKHLSESQTYQAGIEFLTEKTKMIMDYHMGLTEML